MKKKILIGSLGVFTLLMASCNTNPHNWTKEQQDEVHKKCTDLLNSRGGDEASVADFCDCTTSKTVEGYTYEDAQKLTKDDYKKILSDCSYQW